MFGWGATGWKLRDAGDLDGDHKNGLFWQNASGQVAIWHHNPTTASVARCRSALAPGPCAA